MDVESVPVDQITPYKQNPKAHPPEQVERIAKSIEAFGFKVPVVVDADNVLVAGHGRLLAAERLGIKEVPAIRADDLTPEQVRAYRIADNKVAESEWVEDILKNELADLEIDAMTGFSRDEIDAMFKETEVSEKPEVEFSPELLLEHNYVVLYFDNPLDWQVAVDKFGLKKVRDLVPRKGQPTGIGRVVKGAEWMERFK